jgi:hypothetical protein
MTLGLLKALVIAQVLVAAHFAPRPIHSLSEAVTAFNEQWRETAPNPETLQPLIGKRIGDHWLLYRAGGDRLEIQLDATTGRVQQVVNSAPSPAQ